MNIDGEMYIHPESFMKWLAGDVPEVDLGQHLDDILDIVEWGYLVMILPKLFQRYKEFCRQLYIVHQQDHQQERKLKLVVNRK